MVLVSLYREINRLVATVSSLVTGARMMRTSSMLSMLPWVSTASMASVNISAPVDTASSPNNEPRRYDLSVADLVPALLVLVLAADAEGSKVTDGLSSSLPLLVRDAAIMEGSFAGSISCSRLDDVPVPSSSSPHPDSNCFLNESMSSLPPTPPSVGELSSCAVDEETTSSSSSPSSSLSSINLASLSSSSCLLRRSFTSNIRAALLTALPSLTNIRALLQLPSLHRLSAS
mmetsp:Transcript_30873/g.62627  ORF Transcript_30873/g.62627 Transcript_30873/m.62627 type:complete len:231 (-) Transcript_30873:600-1292(-)